ncbi:MAG: hypothetical protein IK095_00250 [Oscillospiraceae bacterium]|nr:hypothetical protein [Oscillospiraceae bacterium]
MREILLSNGPVFVWAITAFHALMLALSIGAYVKTRRIGALLIALVAFGLFYDALIQALGAGLGEGSVLKGLSRFRFVFHGALIPLMFPICAYGLDLKKTWKIAVWVLTGVVIALGIAEGFATDLVPEQAAGILRMKSGEGTPAWAEGVSMLLAFGTIIPVILAGIAIWIRQKTPLFFLAGLLMFVFAALAPATGNIDLNFLITMFGEVFLIGFFYLYERRKAARDAA